MDKVLPWQINIYLDSRLSNFHFCKNKYRGEKKTLVLKCKCTSEIFKNREKSKEELLCQAKRGNKEDEKVGDTGRERNVEEEGKSEAENSSFASSVTLNIKHFA